MKPLSNWAGFVLVAGPSGGLGYAILHGRERTAPASPISARNGPPAPLPEPAAPATTAKSYPRPGHPSRPRRTTPPAAGFTSTQVWRRGQYGRVGAVRTGSMKEAVDAQLDEFVNDYLTATRNDTPAAAKPLPRGSRAP